MTTVREYLLERIDAELADDGVAGVAIGKLSALHAVVARGVCVRLRAHVAETASEGQLLDAVRRIELTCQGALRRIDQT